MAGGTVSVVRARKVRASVVRNEARWVLARPRNPEKLALAVQRVTGVGLLVYLVFHVFVTGTVASGQGAWEGIMGALRNPVVHVGEILVVTGVAFHAVNGIRVMLLELSPLVGTPARADYPYVAQSLGRPQRSILYASVFMTVLAAVGAALVFWGM